MINLLPCPFCGGHAYVEQRYPEGGHMYPFGIGVHGHNEKCPIKAGPLTLYETEAEAEEAWNSRTPRLRAV